MSDSSEYLEKIATLEKVNETLLKSIQLLEDKIIRDPRTGLFNEDFFENYIMDILNASLPTRAPGAILFISIDNFGDINLHYGSDRADEILKKYASYLKNITSPETILFRLSGALFACYLSQCEKSKAIEIAETIRISTAQAEIFICFITVSIGVISFEDLFNMHEPQEINIVDFIIDAGKQRLNIARKHGSNQVCADSNLKEREQNKRTLLLADSNVFRLAMLADLFPRNQFQVLTAKNGPEVLEIITKHEINLIICDCYLPGSNAIEIKRTINKYSRLMGIPFIIITDHKHIDSIQQAYSAGVLMIIERPIYIDEILAIAQNFSKGKFL